MTTYMIQACLGDAFEDLYVQAATVEQAIEKAKILTNFKSRWTRFVA